MFVDTHAHVYKSIYGDVDKVVNDALFHNVKIIVNCAENIDSSYEVIELSKKYNNMYCTIGIHPEHASEYKNEELDVLEQLASSNKVIAIGEIGLDYYYSRDNRDDQIKLFESQLSIAEKNKLPVIIHSRNATDDMINILKKHNVKGIIHCFSGSLETAKVYIKMGFKLGIGGIITFKNAKLKDIINDIDLKNIVLETDCPYLTPEPFRKYKNEPKYVEITGKFISNVSSKSIEEIENLTTQNAYEIFDLIKHL